MSGRAIKVLGIRPNHPRRPARSFITLDLVLSYLRDQPVESVVLTVEQALQLAEQALIAARVVSASDSA